MWVNFGFDSRRNYGRFSLGILVVYISLLLNFYVFLFVVMIV